MKFISIIWLFLSTTGYAASESIVDYIKNGIDVQFVDLHDPGYIELKLESGEIISTTYSGADYMTLNMWEGNNRLRNRPNVLKLFYSLEQGVIVRDPETNLNFRLDGVLATHPIDIAFDICVNNNSSNYGSKGCQKLKLEAWDAELNRAYQSLGGSSNEKLKATQLAWIKYRDAQIEYLQSVYSNRPGRIWGSVYLSHVVSITKQQANRLISIGQW